MYKMIFVFGLMMTIIFLIISVVLFVRNDVPKLMGDITGRNAKKAVKRMQRQGKKNGLKVETVKRAAGSPENNATQLQEGEAVTLKLCSEDETGLLLEEPESQVPAIFKVLEDITEFHNY